MAANQLRSPSLIAGYLSVCFANSASLALSAAATWLAFQAVPDQTKTLKKVRLFAGTITGTPTTAGCTCDLYSDSAGIPNASTEGPISADSIPASGNQMQWTFASTSVLTGGTPVWFVFKNGTATPASNFPTYQWAGLAASLNTPLPLFAGQGGPPAIMYGWNKIHTTSSGTAWATSGMAGVGGIRLEYTDGTFDGFPVQSMTRASNGGTADRAFGKSEVGVSFNVPANATYNVRGLWFPIFKNGSPGSLRFRLYQGTTLLATTNAIPAASVTASGGDGYAAYFSSSQAISSANNPFRAVFGDATAGDTNTAGYNSNVLTFDSDASSLALKPMNGTLKKTVTSDNTATPVVFTDTSADIIPFALLLDSGGEFTAAASGGMILSRVQIGM